MTRAVARGPGRGRGRSGVRAAGRYAGGFEPDDEPDLLGQYLRQIAATELLDAEGEVRLARRIEAGVRAMEELEELKELEEVGDLEDRQDLEDRPGLEGPGAPEDAGGAGERGRPGAGGGEPPAERRRRLEAVVRDGLAAKDHMVRANLRLVVAMAKRHAHRGLPLLDVIQEGNLGLIRAVEKFDHTKGFKFSTYATWWIRQAIERGLATHARAVRLPVHVVEQLQKLAKVERKLHLRLDREPTVEEVARESGLAADKVSWLRRVGRQVVSLDTPVDDTGETVVGDLIPDTEVLQAPEVAEYQALAEELREAVDTLAPREAMILSLRYGLHDGHARTLKEVAEHVGLTRERVRQLEKQSLERLREQEPGERLLAWAG